MIRLFLLSLLATSALAQEEPASEETPAAVPAEPEAPPATLEQVNEEPADPSVVEGEADLVIEVISEAAVKAARDEIVRTMEDLGWKAKRRRNGEIVFRGPEGWMGKAHLFESGDIHFTTPVLAFNGPRETGGNDAVERGFDNDAQSGTVGISVAPLPSGRKVRSAQVEIREAVQPLVLDYRKKIQSRHFGSYVGSLPGRFDALWEQGESIAGNPTVETHEGRRAEILEFWSSRLESPEGRVVTRTIEGWLRNVVQTSEHPVTAAEQAEAEARRADGRKLDI